MGYEGDFAKRNEIKKTSLSQEWRFITHMLSMCISNRKGNQDALNLDWSAAMLRICQGKPFNISQLIFNCLSSNAQQSGESKWIRYPRFVQMIINSVAKDIPKTGEIYNFTILDMRFYTDCKNPKPHFFGKVDSIVRRHVSC
ncbi:hypothetical protein Hanom_Chr14g01269461 [Helianthus anomalus]